MRKLAILAKGTAAAKIANKSFKIHVSRGKTLATADALSAVAYFSVKVGGSDGGIKVRNVANIAVATGALKHGLREN